jgi:hypothetical protein
VAQFVELGDQAMQELISKLPKDESGKERLEIPITNWKNYYTTSTANTSVTINNTGAKFASLKSLILTQRQITATATYFPFSSVANNISNYQFKIGPQTIPATAPSKLPEMFAEVVKAMGSIADVNYNPNIDFTSYTQTVSTPLAIATDASYNASSSGSFYIGIDLENYPNAPKDMIYAGMNTTTDDVQINLNYKTGGPAVIGTNPIRYDVFACFDCVLACKNGVCYRNN